MEIHRYLCNFTETPKYTYGFLVSAQDTDMYVGRHTRTLSHANSYGRGKFRCALGHTFITHNQTTLSNFQSLPKWPLLSPRCTQSGSLVLKPHHCPSAEESDL